jgi:hypothetical protein
MTVIKGEELFRSDEFSLAVAVIDRALCAVDLSR